MVDFRYHALSLVAVFLALGIGIVLGVTIGDSLVSDADRNLRESLRDDVTEAREQVGEEQALGSRRDEVIEDAAEVVGEGRLRGVRVVLIAIGELPGNVGDSVEEGVEATGGELVRRAVYDPPDLGRRPAQLRRAATRIGRGINRGFRSGPVDAVVIYRHPPDEADGEDAARALELRETFEEGLSNRLRDNAVGVEALDTDPSQVSWYEDRVMPSVDNVDVAAGRLALVLLLQDASVADITGDRPEGAFGYKDTADEALPDPSD
jgi:hypothetical protein